MQTDILKLVLIQHANDRRQRPEYFRPANDKNLRVGTLKRERFQDVCTFMGLITTIIVVGVYPHLPFALPVWCCHQTKTYYSETHYLRHHSPCQLNVFENRLFDRLPLMSSYSWVA